MFHKQCLVLQTEGILLLFKIKYSSFIHYISAAASHPPHLPAPPSTPQCLYPLHTYCSSLPFHKRRGLLGLSTEYDITSYITTRHTPSYQVWARQSIEGKGSQKQVKSQRNPAPTIRSPTKHQANNCNI